MNLISERKIYPYFEFREGIEIQITYVNDDDTDDILKSAAEITYRKHQKERETNYLKFNRRLAKKAIVGWKPFKRANLRHLLSPDKKMVLEDNEKMDDEVSFTPEMRDFIIDNTHIQFLNWVIEAARDAELFTRAAEKQELENLSHTSSGKEAPTD